MRWSRKYAYCGKKKKRILIFFLIFKPFELRVMCKNLASKSHGLLHVLMHYFHTPPLAHMHLRARAHITHTRTFKV